MAKIKETCTLYKLLAVLGLAKTAEMTKDFDRSYDAGEQPGTPCG